MKKMIALVMTMLLATGVFATTAFAATGINTYEQKVLDKISAPIKITNIGKSYKIPADYVAAAENYFQTIDMTQAQYNEIISIYNSTINMTFTDSEKATIQSLNPGSSFSLKTLPQSVKQRILTNGQNTVAVVGLKLTFDGTNVVIVRASDNQTVFSNTPVIKATGASAAAPAAPVEAASVGVAILLVTAALFFLMKKSFSLRAEANVEA